MSQPPPAFSVPRDGQIYIDTIHSRCRQLIKTGIWRGMDTIKLDSWLNNFVDQEERYFAACVLDSLIYRSPEQTTALLFELFERSIPQVNREEGARNPISGSWLEHLRGHPDAVGRKIVIVPVLRRGDPPTKSGPLLARKLRRILNIHERHMIWPWQVVDRLDEIEAILFVDDLVGSGRQFCRFVEDFKLAEIVNSKYSIYASLAAHEKGFEHIRKRVPNLSLVTAEILNSKLDLFSEESPVFQDGLNCAASARQQYKKILKRVGFTNSKASAGFGRLGLVYSFDHATPNNSLPLIWWSNPIWKPLFER